VLWILSTTNVLPLLNGDNHGGYGVVCKVRIEIFDCIPNMIELVGKALKIDDKWKTYKQQLVEALACLWEHSNVIKFLVTHTKTMEAYTMCWWYNYITIWANFGGMPFKSLYIHAKTSLYYLKSSSNSSTVFDCNLEFTFTVYGSSLIPKLRFVNYCSSINVQPTICNFWALTFAKVSSI
jgi:hypothetical protein